MNVGQVMKEHKTPYPILIHLLAGNIELGVQGEKSTLESGDIVALDGDIPHDLMALENSVIRLTLSKFDKVERLNSIVKS